MSEEIRKLQERKQKLLASIEFVKQKKKQIIAIPQTLLSQYNSGRITRTQYYEQLNKALGGKSAEQWIKYYEEYIGYYKYQIELAEKLIKEQLKRKAFVKPTPTEQRRVYGSYGDQIKKKIKIVPILTTLVIIIFAGLLIFSIYSFGPTVFEKTLDIAQGFGEDEVRLAEGVVGELVTEKPVVPVTLEDEDIEILEQDVVQYQAVVGQPVMWKKQFTTGSLTGFDIKLPEDSENVVVKSNGKDITNLASIGEEWIGKEINVKLRKSKLTGNVIGNVAGGGEDYEIVYETPAPIIEVVQEGERTNLKITGPDTIHYQNVLSFAEIPETLKVGQEGRLKLYQTKHDGIISNKQIKITAYDTDENGLLDYVEWITQMLSEWEGYIIIEITNAEHLDVNKEFISDVYEQVRAQDDIWSEEINDGEYVRVSFEQMLDSSKDITIYPRIVSGEPRIEVYENGLDVKIAEFSNLSEGKNTIYLTSLVGQQDVFDLKVVGGSVEFDWIVDPIYEASEGAGNILMYEKRDTIPTSPTDYTFSAISPDYAAIQTSDDSRWVTELATAENNYDSQIFHFDLTELVSTPGVTINSLNLTWEGYGEPYIGYTTDISFWNWQTTSWEEVISQETPNSMDIVLNHIISSGVSDYIEVSTNEVAILVSAKNAIAKTTVYVTPATTQGDLADYADGVDGRAGADTFCQNNKPANLPASCENIHAFLSINSSDSIANMDDRGWYPSSESIYWWHSTIGVFTQIDTSWNNMVNNPIDSSQQTGTGISTSVWTGTDNDGTFYNSCGSGDWDASGSGGANIGSGTSLQFDINNNYWLNSNNRGCKNNVLYPLRCIASCVGNSLHTDYIKLEADFSAPPVYGELNITMVSPDVPGPTQVIQNDYFNVIANVSCEGTALSTCGDVTGKIRYNQTTNTPDTEISKTIDAQPFYSIDGWHETLGKTVFNDSVQTTSVTGVDNDTFIIAFRDNTAQHNGAFKVHNLNGSVELGETIFSFGDTYSISTTRMDGDTFVIAYYHIDDGYKGKFVVYNIDGTEELVGGGVFHSASTSDVSITTIDSDSFAISYVDNAGGNSGDGRFVVYNINGDLEYGPFDFHGDLTDFPSITSMGNNLLVFSYEDLNQGIFAVYDFTTGNEILQRVYETGAISFNSITSIDSDTFVIMYANNAQNVGKFVVYNIDGNPEYSKKTFVNLGIIGGLGSFSIIGLDEDTFAMAYETREVVDGFWRDRAEFAVHNINGALEYGKIRLDEGVWSRETSITKVGNSIAVSYLENSLNDGFFEVYNSGASLVSSCQDVTYNNPCQMKWKVYATGDIDSSYKIDANVSSNYVQVPGNETEDAVIKIIESNTITECRDLTSENTVYTMNADITNWVAGRDSCINITAQNITFDCAGKSIDINQPYIGIYSNQFNTTIKNCEVSMNGGNHGIYLQSNSNNTLTNINVSLNYVGIYLDSSSNNNLTQIIANSNSDGIYLQSNSNNNQLNNIITMFNEVGIDLKSSSNNNLTQITANSNTYHGIFLSTSSNNNNLSNITVNSNSRNGIYLSSSSNNNQFLDITMWNCSGISSSYACINNIFSSGNSFENTYINYTTQSANGIFLWSNGVTNSSNNLFKNIKIENINGDDVYIDRTGAYALNNTFLNATYSLAKESVSGAAGTIGLIRSWYYQANVTNNGNPVSLANLSAYNVTENPDGWQFNLTSNSSGFTNITEIIEYVNTGTKSYYSNYTIDTIASGGESNSHGLNVTWESDVSLNPSFGGLILENIELGEAELGCDLIITEDLTLTQDMNCLGTAITIGVNNVVLDCAGNTIIGDQTGYGINITNQVNVTVKNCLITNFTRAINLDNTDISVFDNLSIYNNVGDNSSVYLKNSNNNNITNSNFTNNNASYNSGLYLQNSDNNYIINNIFEGNRINNSQMLTYTGGMIFGSYFSDDNVILNNTFKYNLVTTGTPGYDNEYIYGSPFFGLRSSHRNVLKNINFIGNNLSVYSFVQGGGIIGLLNSNDNNFSDIYINDNVLSFYGDDDTGSTIEGGIIGLRSSSRNFFMNTSVEDNFLEQSSSFLSFHGGGIIGVRSGSDNTFINNFIDNNTLFEISITYGGGIIGVRDSLRNNFTNNILINNNISEMGFLQSRIYSGAAMGTYGSSVNNSYVDNIIQNNSFMIKGPYGIVGSYGNPYPVGDRFINTTIIDNLFPTSLTSIVSVYGSFSNFSLFTIVNNSIIPYDGDSDSGDGIFLNPRGDNNTFNNFVMEHGFADGANIYLSNGATDNLFLDINLIDSPGNSIDAFHSGGATAGLNNFFVNVTSDTSKENVDSSQKIIKMWHYQANVTNNGIPVEGANISVSSSQIFSIYSGEFNLTTGSDGLTNKTWIIDYVTDGTAQGGTQYYYSNYTIDTIKGSLSDSHELNVTFESLKGGFGGLIFENIELEGPDISPPHINFTGITPGNEVITEDSFIIGVNASDVGLGDNNVSTFIDFNNSLVGWWRMDDVGYWCYQESINIEDQGGSDGSCGQDYGGSYGFSSAPYVEMTYVKPFGASPKSKWKVKHGTLAEYEVDIPLECWNYDPDNLYFRVYSNQAQTYVMESYGECRDGLNSWRIITLKESGIPTSSNIADLATPHDIYDGVWDEGDYYKDNDLKWVRCLSGSCEDFVFYEEAMNWFIEDVVGNQVADMSDYINTGVVVGTPVQVDGKLGKAMEFEGDSDYINAGNDPSLNLTGALTLSAWIYPKSFEDTDRFTIVEKGCHLPNCDTGGGEVPSGFSFWAGAMPSCGDGKPRALNYVILGGYVVNTNSYVVDSDKWQHVAVVYNQTDGGYVNFYVDGVEIESAVYNSTAHTDCNTGGLLYAQGGGDPLPTERNLSIGIRRQDMSFGFNGSIDDVMIFDRALSSVEIAGLYANQSEKILTQEFRDLVNGNYTFKAYAQDTAGNVNETLVREVKIESTIAPKVIWVEDMVNIDPNSGAIRNVVFNVSIYDANGEEDISNVKANFSKNGIVREDSSCSLINGDGNYANYSCTIGMQYFDEPGTWNVVVDASDGAGLNGFNVSESFNYVPLRSFYQEERYVNWTGLEAARADQLSDNNITIYNRGNVDIINIIVNASDLNGIGAYPQDNIGVSNITTRDASLDVCSSPNVLIKNDNVSSFLAINYGEDLFGKLGFCLDVPDVRPQKYESERDWNIDIVFAYILSIIKFFRFNFEIAILLSVVAVRVRKKSKKKRLRLSEEDLLGLDSVLKDKYNIGLEELLESGKQGRAEKELEIKIPVVIFNQGISPAEALAKYLKENMKMRFSEIARLINRDERTIWINYRDANKKKEEKMKVENKILVSVEIFADRRLSVLESVVYYFKEHGYRNIEIAEMLGKDQRNISTLYSRIKKKMGINYEKLI